ncbi:MAG: hypothetical protein GY946_15280 [bacterium]|nr:hypothetical protein [bacterium]
MASGLGRRMRKLKGAARRAAIREVVEAFTASGQSRVAYCRDIGIAPVTLSRWEAEFGVASPRDEAVPRFVELGGEAAASAFHVELSGGVRVHVPADFRERDLLRLLRTLTAGC